MHTITNEESMQMPNAHLQTGLYKRFTHIYTFILIDPHANLFFADPWVTRKLESDRFKHEIIAARRALYTMSL
jgi:hypothetical protein